ncbi:kinesin [Trypanosoma grayi]|uniref:kinesin n=1 Tax=Trypanosoma grayi TaxID=71804 RepID=UPI0004F3F94B|nr:kinesin [Trypanosoma grayi]KEG11789.1 kinesin [Trypanosoma grayi]
MSIEVHVRIRPHVPNGVWSSAETVLYSTHNPNTRYVYNKVHHIGTTNHAIFQGIEALVHAGFDGKNVTVMAYGQTGSGKTHSMNGTDTDPGVVPRTAKLLLDLRKNFPGTHIVAYFTEIYNESVKDLLEPQRGELALHDAPDGGIYFDKKSVPIETLEDFVKLQSVAERNRKYGVTNLNDHSSRSHMILTFEINRGNRQVSTINLVDLAGSESASRANTDGVLLREGGFINKSLLTLGNVVDAIVEKRPYVPYRDAKLTRILRNCLGGSGMTFILCCVNPSHENFEQTVASLRFTQRAMKIKNDPVMVLNMPPLFTHQYGMGAEELVCGFRDLCDAHYQRGLRDAFMYTGNTMSSVVSHFDGQISDSLHAMANAQRLLIAHDHAMAVDQVGRLYNQLHELSRQRLQSKDIEEHERKRQRDTAGEIDARKEKIARLEAEVKEKNADADTELAGWEYQLYEARQRRLTPLELLLTTEKARRCRVQYEWAVCMERISARCVPAIKALGPATPPVADKHAVVQQMRQRLQQARQELADLTVAHDMIKDDLPELQREVEESSAVCATSSSTASLSPQPRPNDMIIDADATNAEIEERIHQLEVEEKALMTRAVHVARCESTRRLRESLGQPRSRTPPTCRSAVCHVRTPPPSQPKQQGKADASPANARGGTGCYASPVQQRSPTPRTARTIFPTSEVSPEVDTFLSRSNKAVSPCEDEQLADGVRRALGVLRDVRSKLMRPVQGRRRRVDAAASIPDSGRASPAPETARSGSRHCRRTVSHTPQDDDMTLAEVYMRKDDVRDEEPVVGIAARRRMEGAPVRPNVERALWRLSLSPAGTPLQVAGRSRSRRR